MEGARGAAACYAPRVSSGRLQAVAATLAALSATAALAADPVARATSTIAALTARPSLFVESDLSGNRAGVRSEWSPSLAGELWFGHGGDFPADTLVGTTLKTMGWSASLFVTRTFTPAENDGPRLWRSSSFLNAQLTRNLGHHVHLSVDLFNVFDRHPASLGYFVLAERAGDRDAGVGDSLDPAAAPRVFALRLRRTF